MIPSGQDQNEMNRSEDVADIGGVIDEAGRNLVYPRAISRQGAAMAVEPPASAYEMAHDVEAEALATFAVLVDNEPGVLHRVVGLFAARGYNIESLTVAETDRRAHTSRITIVTRGTPQVLAQIEAQLQKMVSTRHVQDVTKDPNGLPRDLALVKGKGVGA